MHKPLTLEPVTHAGAYAGLSKAASLWPSPQDIGERPLIWVNGRLLPKNQAMVSVYDHGLLYGDGVFEGIRVYRGKIFKCAQHMKRLYECAEKIHLKIPVTPDEMVLIQRQCIEANNLTEGYIRLVVTRGYGTLGLDPRRCPVPGIICIADQISLYGNEFYENGMRVVVAKRPKTPRECLDPRIKSLNYLNNILAKVEAINAGCDEAIMLSPDGWVTECTGDNIFVVKNGVVHTPPHTTGVSGSLEGITERFVREELIPMCGLRCVVKEMRLEEVLNADEVFLTGTAAEIIGVNEVDLDGPGKAPGKKISQGEGPITNRLRKKFREVVTSDHVPED
ncbi:MAG TPA: branched-chain-amino-acid transaminase [Phycisphaerales bacterium]|nr:branched-chain-amino-acid transaminase [Phycisphaerales bacterium]